MQTFSELLITCVMQLIIWLRCVWIFRQLRKKPPGRVRHGGGTDFAEKRIANRKRHFDELAEDSRLINSEDCFRVNVFYKILDIASNHIVQRLQPC